MASSFNTYISAKRVRQFTDSCEPVASGELTGGTPWVAGFDPDQPALLIQGLTQDGELVRVRLDFRRLVLSLFGAEAADAERWEPLRPGRDENWYGNNQVTVHVQHHRSGVVQLSYHRHDRAPIHDWRVGQRIKNEVLGAEWEAVEVYPAESRLVDTSNEFHMWAINGPVPLGFDYRDVGTQDQADIASPGAVQRDDPDADTSAFDPNQPERRPVRTPIWEESA